MSCCRLCGVAIAATVAFLVVSCASDTGPTYGTGADGGSIPGTDVRGSDVEDVGADAPGLDTGGGGDTGAHGDTGGVAPNTSDETGDTWLLAMYVAADNNLDPASADDLAEIIDSEVPVGVTVRVFIDRAAAGLYEDAEVPGLGAFSDAKLLEITRAGLSVVEEYGEIDSMDPDTVHAFVRDAAEFDADRRVFVFWDHGGSITYGQDETSGSDGLDLATLIDTFRVVPGDPDSPFFTFDLIGFDACLMSSVEALTAFAPIAPLYVASAELEPGAGWDYSAVVPAMGTPGATPAAVGRTIVSSFVSYYQAHPEAATGVRVTQALWRTDVSPALGAFDALAGALEAYAGAVGSGRAYAAFARALAASYAYGDAPGEPARFVDFGSLLNALPTAFADAEIERTASDLRAELSALRVEYANDRAFGTLGLSVCVDESAGCVGTVTAGITDTLNDDALATLADADRGAPSVDVSIAALDDSTDPVFVDVDYYAADDTALATVEAAIGIATETELFLLTSEEIDAWGSTTVSGTAALATVAIALYPRGATWTDDSLAAIWADDDGTSVPVVVVSGGDELAGMILLDDDSLSIAQLAVESEGGEWAVLPWDQVGRSNLEIAPVIVAYEFATDEFYESVGAAVPARQLVAELVYYSPDDATAVVLAEDIAGNISGANVFLYE
ncbi:MAG: hypothetical protein H6698_07100 [Myxococcales bacterium]|nr:hypothetical protein [Myxococcales bacterium]MCB9534074.1 hypothetical protein [Myxococcales bacterium]